jgi:pyruvate dehydrogenase E1 component alpha subunit
VNTDLSRPPEQEEQTSSLEESTLQEPEEIPPRYQLVDHDGNYDPEILPDLSADQLRDLFRWMLRQRVIDERMVKLQRRGEMGTYASGRGQEASIIGCAYALNEENDWLFPYGREATAMLKHGMSLRDLLLYWRGVMDANILEDANVFPMAIAIGTHIPFGVGHAWGMRLDGADAVSAMYFGEGHPSTGELQSGMNFAGVVNAPALFYCQNNQYSISVPFEQQTKAKSVAQKAIAWGFPGVRVDGNDVLAVYDACRKARTRAVEGEPVLIEAATYRLDAHTTNDDPSRYRTKTEVEEWEHHDPVDRFRHVLKNEGVWEMIDEEEIREELNAEFDEAKAAADAYDAGGVDELFAYLHEEMPPELERQLKEFKEFLEQRPDAMDYIEHRPKG